MILLHLPYESERWKRLTPKLRRRAILSTLESKGYMVPSVATHVRLCLSTGTTVRKETPCFYPIQFFANAPDEKFQAGIVKCPMCGSQQEVRKDGGIPALTVYELPPYNDRYERRNDVRSKKGYQRPWRPG